MKYLLSSLFILCAGSAQAAAFSQNSDLNIGIFATPVVMNTLVIPGSNTCASQMPYPFDLPYPNYAGELEVVLNYEYPVAPACSGYDCLPNVVLLKNGSPLSFQGASATSEGLVFVFDSGYAVGGDTLQLQLYHSLGHGTFWAYFGSKAIIRGVTMCP